MLSKADAFTLANAALGFLAITYISDGKYAAAMGLILLAVIADGLDGIVARRFGGGKAKMGDYLDIMADYLSFCVAPAILFYKLYFNIASSPLGTLPSDILVGFAAGLFMTLGLLRLARHVALAGPEAGRFQGLPTTGAGLFATLLVAVGGLGDVLTSLLIIAVAWLMVSEAAYPKVRGALAAASGALVLACAAVVAALATSSPGSAVVLSVGLAGAGLYAFSGVAFVLFRMRLPIFGKAATATPSSAAPIDPQERLKGLEDGLATSQRKLAASAALALHVEEDLQKLQQERSDVLTLRQKVASLEGENRALREAAAGASRAERGAKKQTRVARRAEDSQEVDPDA